MADEPVQELQDPLAIARAVNFGGPAHLDVFGVQFEGDNGGAVARGAVGNVRGAQDPVVYQTYIEGDISLEYPLANGLYDLTFYFVEPVGLAPGEREFDVIAQGQVVIKALDISLSRSSAEASALKRTVIGVSVEQGKLAIALRPGKGVPVISGLSIQARRPDPGRWRQVWADEFDGAGMPDDSRWSIDQWPARKVNDEDQAYTARSSNVRLENGRLILEAHKEHYNDAQYTSGRVHGLGLGDILYGRVDIRAKLPAGRGLWSALWMLPSDPYKYATTCDDGVDWQGNADCDAWPNSGEIDIMEHVGYDMRRVHSTVHTQRFFSSGPDLRNASIEVDDVASEFHVYSLVWTPDSIRVMVDGVEFYHYMRLANDWKDWPFDHSFHLIMNLAVGGLWGRAGGGIDPDVFPAKLEVDYVRVFEQVKGT